VTLPLPKTLPLRSTETLSDVPRGGVGSEPNPRPVADSQERRGSARRPLYRKASPSGAPDIRSVVLRRWKKVLGTDPDIENQTWSEAGGDSLKLFEFVLPLERELGCALPFDLFDGEMQLDDIVSCIKGAMGPRISDSGATGKPTVFLMPGIGGDEPLLAGFRNELRDRVRFIVPTYPGLADLLRPGFGFDHIIESVCDQIAAETPEREVQLLGYSLGGIVAYAVAARLAASGWRVKFLGILDTSLELAQREALSTRLGALQSARGLLADISRRGIFSGLIFKLGLHPRLRPFAKEAASLTRWAAQSRAYLWYRHKAVLFLRWDLTLRWLRGLEPSRLSVPAVLFRSEEYADESPDMGWGALLCPLTVVPVRGNHHSMFRENSDEKLGQLFFDALTSGDSKRPGAGSNLQGPRRSCATSG
jgi:thioesterase domain-containing protein/acyl carrier protein